MNARRLLESVAELEQGGALENKPLQNDSAGASPGTDIAHGKTN